MLPLVLMFVVLYFIMIRPQMKQQKEHKAMIEAIAKGDEVVIGGGMLGKVSKLGETYVSIEVAGNVEVQVQRTAIVAGAAQGHDQVIRCGAARIGVPRKLSPHEPLPCVEVRDARHRVAGRRALHRAQFLRRGACGAGVGGQGHA